MFVEGEIIRESACMREGKENKKEARGREIGRGDRRVRR